MNVSRGRGDARLVQLGLRALLTVRPLGALAEYAVVVLRHRFPRARPLSALATAWLAATLRWRPGDIYRVARLGGGARLAIDLRDDWQRGLYYRGEYEPETTAAIRRLVRAGDVVLDVGANAGYHSCLAAARGAHVHAFEPTPALVRLLCRTRDLNGFGDRLIVNPAAVSAEDGEAVLHLSPQPGNTGLSSLLPLAHLSAGETLRVPAVRLDTYCSEHHIARIRLLKLDVEGAELDVLAGATRVLTEIRPDAIICEIGGFEHGCRPSDVLRRLADAGYAPHEMTADGLTPSAAGDPAELDARWWEQRNLCFLRAEGTLSD